VGHRVDRRSSEVEARCHPTAQTKLSSDLERISPFFPETLCRPLHCFELGLEIDWNAWIVRREEASSETVRICVTSAVNAWNGYLLMQLVAKLWLDVGASQACCERLERLRSERPESSWTRLLSPCTE